LSHSSSIPSTTRSSTHSPDEWWSNCIYIYYLLQLCFTFSPLPIKHVEPSMAFAEQLSWYQERRTYKPSDFLE
jgi:hypothetical protein